jgi:hypothetical protein
LPRGRSHPKLGELKTVCSVRFTVRHHGSIALSFEQVDATTILGVKFPLRCKTSKPIQFPLSENLVLHGELLNFEVGSHFVGTTEFPSVTCGLKLFKVLNEDLLTSDFSGPGKHLLTTHEGVTAITTVDARANWPARI